MLRHSDLPLDYFDGETGISLSDAELIEAVADYLAKRGVNVPPLKSFFHMAKDDQLFTI